MSCSQNSPRSSPKADLPVFLRLDHFCIAQTLAPGLKYRSQIAGGTSCGSGATEGHLSTAQSLLSIRPEPVALG
uniref:Uncharacterized protein n=1 Tax=Ralstonia solanacearum TaxID=305 RepID=A0A0S4W7B6_RALSL|nr:protein of unknown function [Ralstonia solanacearum]CUV30973.1 protein of unknown function [Ralstonia solanacearum]CUV37119.1 protein of unknown function [Ralstonia solanacearum]CUV42466.1 protein of unknown function [Ralstonia solanacearum]CUV56050.1 protein of unknown function [Ralstonia solanacearum]